MDYYPAHFLAFIGLSLVVLVVPGPSILLIVANVLQRGRLVGLFTVAGGLMAMGAQLAVVLLVMTTFANELGERITWIRWAGAAYLFYLGVQCWRGARQGTVRGRAVRNYSSAVLEGFAVALANPGTWLLFAAFFPQFLNTDVPAGPQLLFMAVVFLVLTTLVDTAYVLLASRLSERLYQPSKRLLRNRLADVTLIVAAILLVLVNAD